MRIGKRIESGGYLGYKFTVAESLLMWVVPSRRVDATLLISIPAMRKIVLGLGISLDGYIARPAGTPDFLFMPRDYSMAPFFATVDTAVKGPKTLDAALRTGGSFSSSSMKTYVFSHSKPPGERDGVVFTNRSPAAIVRELRKGRGKDLGGGELAREFLKADLIDELHLGIVPRLVGEGIPLFPSGFPQPDFSLVENKTYSRGMIALKYRRVRSKGKRKS
ncbi:MAG TPA: dihydrofolate reductase family protein [Terriglobales bacterium]|nr:dihydrofolate reductase family protein [Terriglobales bacterium]